MAVVFQKWITRQDLKNNPDTYYVFGDNSLRIGLGGQAKEMRGEPNAIGVTTKWAPGWAQDDFFSDDKFDTLGLSNDMDVIQHLLEANKTVVFPSDGLGTGLSMLVTKAPKVYKLIYRFVEMYASRSGVEIPWEIPK